MYLNRFTHSFVVRLFTTPYVVYHTNLLAIHTYLLRPKSKRTHTVQHEPKQPCEVVSCYTCDALTVASHTHTHAHTHTSHPAYIDVCNTHTDTSGEWMQPLTSDNGTPIILSCGGGPAPILVMYLPYHHTTHCEVHASARGPPRISSSST